MKKSGLVWLMVTLGLACCKDKGPENPEPGGALCTAKIKFVHRFGPDTLQLSSKWYINAAGDSVRISKFRYYISNIKLKAGNQSLAIANSYHLVDEVDPQMKTITLQSLPEVNGFDAIEFTIGVDSAKCASGAHDGDLDVINNMYWGWASGYINSKLEGYYQDSGEVGFTYHVGGYSYPNSTQRTVTIPFSSVKLVTSRFAVPTLVIMVDINEYFKNPLSISLKQLNSVHMPSTDANTIANNYADMFSFGAIQ